MVKKLTKEQAEKARADLPPAGHARDEELARRKDTLEEAAEKLANDEMIGKIDPKVLKPDRELQEIFHRPVDALSVPNALPEYDYCWVWTGATGQKIWEKKSMRVGNMQSSWVVVQGDMPEAREYRFEDTTRRIGDIILMRILKVDHEILLTHIKERRQKQEYGVVGDLIALGEKHRGKGFVVHADPDSRFASNKESMMDTVRKRAASGAGMKAVDKMVREGTVPGIPTPGGE